ncbi:MAG: response regulator [Oscillibacter sp.]|nr:response regulator [Oscillibacter sp.]
MSLCFLAVDDEMLALADLTNALEEAEPEAQVCAFTSPEVALAAVKKGEIRPKIAFLDIQMRTWTGLRLAQELREVLPEMEIVFVTAYPQYALESYSVHARGYLLKPVTSEAVRKELNVIIGSPGTAKQKLRVHCFGNFEVFFDGKPLKFSRSKSKELFAYLIYRNGATCSIKEISAVLFEDRSYDSALKNQTQTFKSDLMKALRAVGQEDVVIKGHNCLSVDQTKVDCDYYRYLSGDSDTVNGFTGEFMTQYSWAEMTAAALCCKLL